MNEYFRLLTQFLHVAAAVAWMGGGFYSFFVQLPGLLSAPPAARGPVSAQLTPRQVRYIRGAAEATIVTGLLNLWATARLDQFMDPFAQRWTIVLGIGIILALALYGLLRARVFPWSMRILELGPKAAAGDAAAAAEIPQIIERLKRIGRVQVAMGILIILAMVTARLS